MHKPYRSAEDRLNAHLHTPEGIIPTMEVKPGEGRKKEYFWSWVIAISMFILSVTSAAVAVCILIPKH